MGDAVVIEHESKVYKIDIDDLAQYEVDDEATKQELLAEGGAQSYDEVEGFAMSKTNIIIIRR